MWCAQFGSDVVVFIEYKLALDNVAARCRRGHGQWIMAGWSVFVCFKYNVWCRRGGRSLIVRIIVGTPEKASQN